MVILGEIGRWSACFYGKENEDPHAFSLRFAKATLRIAGIALIIFATSVAMYYSFRIAFPNCIEVFSHHSDVYIDLRFYIFYVIYMESGFSLSALYQITLIMLPPLIGVAAGGRWIQMCNENRW